MQSLKTQFIETYLTENPKKFSNHGLRLLLTHIEDKERLYVGHDTAVIPDKLSTYKEVDYEDFFERKRHDGSFSRDILDYDNKGITDTEIMRVVSQHLKSQNIFVDFTCDHTVVYDTMKSPRALFVKTFMTNHENKFSEEGLNILIKYLEEDADGAEPEDYPDELLTETIVGWFTEEYYDGFFYDEAAKGNIKDIHPSDYELDADDTSYDLAMRNAVQRRLESKRVFVGFTLKDKVVYCRGNYCDD